MNYHRIHIGDFSHVSADLYALAHAYFFNWRCRHKACFNKLKDLAISASMLCLPSPDRLFILDTDATSGIQTGATLSQVQEVVDKSI